MDLKQITNRMIEIRKKKGLNQEKWGEILGIGAPAVSLLEANKREYSLDYINKIAEYFNVSIGFLLEESIPLDSKGNYRLQGSINKKKLKKEEAGTLEIDLEKIVFRVRQLIAIYKENELDFTESMLPSFTIINYSKPDEHFVERVKVMLGLEKKIDFDTLVNRLTEIGVFIFFVDEHPAFSGYSSRPGYPVIILNRNLPTDRQLFTLAHELGHLICHPSNEIEIAAAAENDNGDMEKDMNLFAGMFILPTPVIEEEMKFFGISKPCSFAHGDINRYKKLITSLSKKSNGSEEMVFVRLRHLGFVDYTQKSRLIVRFDESMIARNQKSLTIEERNSKNFRDLAFRLYEVGFISENKLREILDCDSDELRPYINNNEYNE